PPAVRADPQMAVSVLVNRLYVVVRQAVFGGYLGEISVFETPQPAPSPNPQPAGAILVERGRGCVRQPIIHRVSLKAPVSPARPTNLRANPDTSVQRLVDGPGKVMSQSLLRGIGTKLALLQPVQAARRRPDPKAPLAVFKQGHDQFRAKRIIA